MIVVVGGGIVGISIAVELAKAGVPVKLIEKSQIGNGCSYGNAGWLTPCFALPLPMPGLFFKSIKWLLNPESPLYIKPEPSLLLMRWMSRFLLSMNEKQARESTEALVRLSQTSLKMYEELAKEFPEIRFEKKGLLMVAQSRSGMASTVDELQRVQEYGVPGKILNPEQIRQMEASLTGALEGGVYFPEEASAEPFLVVKALAEKARRLGVEIVENCEFLGINDGGENSNSISIATSQGEIKSEQVVLATGTWSHALAQKLSLSIPILGGKGYSMIVPPLEIQPLHPIMLLEKKIAITPREKSLRIAGTMEIVNQDFSITHRRVEAIKNGAREFLTLPKDLQVQELWRGLRPITPDGVPLIGRTRKYPKLFLACGHQMLGLQSGLGTGKLVADLMTKNQSDLDRVVYNPDRF